MCSSPDALGLEVYAYVVEAKTHRLLTEVRRTRMIVGDGTWHATEPLRFTFIRSGVDPVLRVVTDDGRCIIERELFTSVPYGSMSGDPLVRRVGYDRLWPERWLVG